MEFCELRTYGLDRSIKSQTHGCRGTEGGERGAPHLWPLQQSLSEDGKFLASPALPPCATVSGMDFHLLLLFYATQIALALTPGPDWLYVMSRGVAGGRRSALVSVGGICSGYLADSVLVALGLAALLQSSDAAFEIIRYAGAAYLIYLGARMILSKGMGLESGADADEGGDGEPAGAVVFRQGFLTAVLNPKGLLLFLSLLPQFVSPSAAFPVGLQLLVLGVVHTVNCAIVYSAVGIGAGRLGEILKRRLGLARVIRWLAGSVLIALGLRLVFPGKR